MIQLNFTNYTIVWWEKNVNNHIFPSKFVYSQDLSPDL